MAYQGQGSSGGQYKKPAGSASRPATTAGAKGASTPAFNLVRAIPQGENEKSKYEKVTGLFANSKGSAVTVTPEIQASLRSFQVGDSLCVFTADKK